MDSFRVNASVKRRVDVDSNMLQLNASSNCSCSFISENGGKMEKHGNKLFVLVGCWLIFHKLLTSFSTCGSPPARPGICRRKALTETPGQRLSPHSGPQKIERYQREKLGEYPRYIPTYTTYIWVI